MSRKPRRVRYQVKPLSRADHRAGMPGSWKVVRDGQVLGTFSRKRGEASAVEFATTTARCAWRTTGTRSTVLIYTAGGLFQEERTYGADPTRYKG